jgi:hypothetical protein
MQAVTTPQRAEYGTGTDPKTPCLRTRLHLSKEIVHVSNWEYCSNLDLLIETLIYRNFVILLIINYLLDGPDCWYF